jgi:general secretion pathway protein E
MDLGVEEFLLNAGLNAIVAQRLVRKLCTNCATPHPLPDELIQQYNLEILVTKWIEDKPKLKKPKGCNKCGGSGYKGRVAIIEYLRCDQVIKSMPKRDDFVFNAQAYQFEQGRRSLIQDGMLKALQGITTVEEVMRVAG